MRIRTVLVSAPALALTLGLNVASFPPAGAQTAEFCPPGQPTDRPPGTPVGPGAAPGRPANRPPQYPPGKCQLRLSRSVVAAGGSMVVAGSGFAPGTEVRVLAAGLTLATVTAASTGSFSSDVEIPKSLAPGAYEVTASGAAAEGGTQVLSASLTVAGVAAGAAGQADLGGQLPRTGGGAGTVPMVGAGTVLVAVGTAAVLAARRRRGTRSA